MPTIVNASGTIVPYYKIGGTTVYQGPTDPSMTYEVVTGDFWLDTTDKNVKCRDGLVWKTQDLTPSGVTPGTYPKVTVNVNGIVTAGTTLVSTDIPVLDTSKITSGTFSDARISQSSVTQHQSAITISSSQVSNFSESVDDRVGTLLQAGTGISLNYNDAGDVLTITNTVVGAGEANTASNVGSGYGIFKQKTGVDLEFKTLLAGSGRIVLTNNTNDITIDTPALTLSDVTTALGYTPAQNVHNHDSDYVNVTGDTMTGNLIISPSAGSSILELNASASAVNSILNYTTNGSLRWAIAKDGTAESGSNAGSNFSIRRFNDAGTQIDTPLTINRSTGETTFSGDVNIAKSSATLNISASSGTSKLAIITSSGQNAHIQFHKGSDSSNSSRRWILQQTSTAESGGNAGSDLFLYRCDDAGATIDVPLTISRATGVVNFGQTPTVAGTSLLTTTAGNAAYVNVTGDTMTGDLTISKSTALFSVTSTGSTSANINIESSGIGAALRLVSPASTGGRIHFYTGTTVAGGSTRWFIGKNATAESGSNVGSDFDILRYNDAGVLVDAPITIARSSGVVTFTQVPTVAGTSLLTTTAGNAAYVNVTGDTMSGQLAVQAQTNETIRIGGNPSPLASSYTSHLRADDTGSYIGNNSSIRSVSLRPNDVNVFNVSTSLITTTVDMTITKASPVVLVSASSGSSEISIRSTAGNNSVIYFRTVGTGRWGIFKDGTAESGSNAGSNFVIGRYSDAGSYIDAPLSISRSTGNILLSANLSSNMSIYAGGNITSSGVGSSVAHLPTSGDGLMGVSSGSAGSEAMLAFWNISGAGSNLRWLISKNSTAESGSNAGSNFAIRRFSDAGTQIDSPFSITRSTGYINMPGVYAQTTASAANVFVDSAGNLMRSTSSMQYKTDVEPVTTEYADKILELEPIWYRSLCDGDNKEWSYYGLSAEQVAEIIPQLAQYETTKPVRYADIDDEGNETNVRFENEPLETPIPNGVMYDRFTPLLINIIKRQKQQIDEQQAKLDEQQATITDILNRLNNLENK